MPKRGTNRAYRFCTEKFDPCDYWVMRVDTKDKFPNARAAARANNEDVFYVLGSLKYGRYDNWGHRWVYIDPPEKWAE